jgi:hypothetical protein
MAKSEEEMTVTGMDLQKFRTLPDEERAEAIKDWVLRAFEASLSESDLDLPPNQRR